MENRDIERKLGGLSGRPVERKTAAWSAARALAAPGWSALLALVVYGLVAAYHGGLFNLSRFPYYNYLADAFLHGQLALRLPPPSTHDLVAFGGRYYLYWPPFPAVVLMPFVAIFGTGFSDVAFTVAIGAANVGLVAALLALAERRGLIVLSPERRALLVVFFAFGTVHFTLAPQGRVWFTGQVLGFLFVLLAYLAALGLRGRRAFLLAGAAMAAAVMTRNNMIFAGLFPAYYLVKTHGPARMDARSRRELLGHVLAGAAPVAAALLLLALYNTLRFGSPTEVGLDYHRMAGVFAEEYRRYGAFHPHYIPTNLYYQYLYYPLPPNRDSFMGGSLFLLSPLFLAAFWAWRGPKRGERWFLLGSILLVNVPILLLMGTGWVTFGPRYTLDFTAPLLLLTAAGLRHWSRLPAALLAGISILHYTIGALLSLP